MSVANPLDIIFEDGESPSEELRKQLTPSSLAAFKGLCNQGCNAGTLDYLLSRLAEGSEPDLSLLDEWHTALGLSEKHYKKKPDRVRQHLEEISERAKSLVRDILRLRETPAVQELTLRRLIGELDLLYSLPALKESGTLLDEPPKAGQPLLAPAEHDEPECVAPCPTERLILGEQQPPRDFSKRQGLIKNPARLDDLFYGLANLQRLLKELRIGEQKWPDRRQQRIDLHKYVRERTGHWHDALLADILIDIWPEGGTVNRPDRPISTEGVKRWRHRHELKG